MITPLLQEAHSVCYVQCTQGWRFKVDLCLTTLLSQMLSKAHSLVNKSRRVTVLSRREFCKLVFTRHFSTSAVCLDNNNAKREAEPVSTKEDVSTFAAARVATPQAAKHNMIKKPVDFLTIEGMQQPPSYLFMLACVLLSGCYVIYSTWTSSK